MVLKYTGWTIDPDEADLGALWDLVQTGFFDTLPQETALGITVVDKRFPYGCANRYGAIAIDRETYTLAQIKDPTNVAIFDSRVAFQAALDFATYCNTSYTFPFSPLSIAVKATAMGGVYKIGGRLHAGYGAGGFNSTVFEGAGYMFRCEALFGGTGLVFCDMDDFGINIQGARGTRLRAFSILGRAGTWIDVNNFASNTGPALADDTDPDQWDDPGLGGTAVLDAQHSPYAGITIDAYSGAAPADPYPDVDYPAFLGAVAQYNKNDSSDYTLEDLFIEGFTAAIVNKPSDSDTQADFLKVRDVYIDKCKWGISIGNTQSRNVAIENVIMGNVYSLLTNRQHGRQNGKLGGTIKDLTTYGAIKIIDFRNFYSEPLHFTSFYGETLWRIGDVNQASTNEHSLAFYDSEFAFSAQDDDRGWPGTVLYDEDGFGGGEVHFEGCYFHGAGDHAYGFISKGISFERCWVRDDDDTARDESYKRIAYNATCGGIVTRYLETPERCRFKLRPYNLDANDFALGDDGDGRFVLLPGVIDNAPTSPDSAAADITGDIDIQVKIKLDSYNPGVIQYLVRKGFDSTNDPALCSYALYIIQNQTLSLSLSNGLALFNTTAADISGLGLSDNDLVWFRATCDLDDGGGNRVFTYYYRLADGDPWTQIAAPTSQAGVIASINVTTDDIEVFNGTFGAGSPLGKLYIARAYAGIAGVLRWELDASDAATLSDRSWVSGSTGETWTLPDISPFFSAPRMTARWSLGSRAYGIPFWAEQVQPLSEVGDLLPVPSFSGSVGKSSLGAYALADGVLTMTITGRTDAQFLLLGPDCGDVLWDDDNQATYYVRARTGTTITAELQNNYKVVAGLKTPIEPHSVTDGTVYWRCARLYTPAHYLKGDTTGASGTITNCAQDDGTESFNADIRVGDAVGTIPSRDNICAVAASRITARDQGAGTITLTASTGVYTKARRRLSYFVRQPPANV